MRIDPPPSLAPAQGTIPAATAAADPPDEPPGVWSRFQGLRVGPNRCGSVTPLAPNSDVLVLPKITNPASSQRSTTMSLWAAGFRDQAREPQVIGHPVSDWPRSLSRNGTPAKGPAVWPGSWLGSGLGSRLAGGSTLATIALIRGLTWAARVLAASSTSAADTSPCAMTAASPSASWS